MKTDPWTPRPLWNWVLVIACAILGGFVVIEAYNVIREPFPWLAVESQVLERLRSDSTEIRELHAKVDSIIRLLGGEPEP